MNFPNPDSVVTEADSAYRRACELGNAGDAAGAESLLRSLLIEYPRHRAAAATLATALAGQARTNAAAEVVIEAARHGAFDPADAAQFLRRCHRFENAYEVTIAALGRAPGDAGLRAMAGMVALNLGRFEEAAAHLRAALDAAPDDAGSWLRLAHTKRYSDPLDPDLRRLEQAIGDAALAPLARESIGFALGKVYDDLRRHEDAARVLAEANATAHARMLPSAPDWRTATAQLRALRFPAREADIGDFRPIFVVGLPRSGTTLAASLLSRHFGARNLGETPWVEDTFRRIGASADPELLRAGGEFLAKQLRRDDAPAAFHLDKNPLNFRYVRVILALLPQAKIVWMQRSARDTALSLWMQHFAHPDMGFAYDWRDIADYITLHERAFDDAGDISGESLLRIRYEDMVDDTDAALRTIAAFLGSAPAIGTPIRDTASPIATASLWQARQPVHARSVGRWRHYAAAIPALESLPAG